VATISDGTREAELAIDALFAGIPVAELASALDWYERFLGRPPDMAPNETERTWRLTNGGWIYVVEDPERAGKGVTTLIVHDLEARIEELNSRGIETGEIDRLKEGVRTLVVSDPDGNRIQLGEVSSTG
jgi:catechol 2,3-dioxygenase-like lactoylglutathione lyase family enzyme